MCQGQHSQLHYQHSATVSEHCTQGTHVHTVCALVSQNKLVEFGHTDCGCELASVTQGYTWSTTVT